ncbi:large subunit ribosomal protein L22 [Metamycoplasma subdolum]|uniref:Large ribosomal subunit protein uL22 n=1 Tax=Metamycoplasma subdolum TaxID=92407 RepID=A0A3M0A501_9BACT|nr:large subunit ribosomal protein L22 [Metamycoplasma subdolum]
MTKDILKSTVHASVKMQHISPRKARLVADLIRYKTATKALVILQTTHKKAARIILKLLNSAIANATNNAGLDATQLVISKLLVNDGPTLKRYQPHSRGRAYPILKRTSHFYIELAELNSSFDSFVEEMEKENKTSKESKKEVKKEVKKSVEKQPKKVESAKKTSTKKEVKPKTEKTTSNKKEIKKPEVKKDSTKVTSKTSKKEPVKKAETAKTKEVKKPAKKVEPKVKKETKKGDK